MYRVRSIPQEYTWKQVEELLRLVLELDNAADSIEFRSIASNPDQTKVATVCFNNPPQCLSSTCNEWRFKVPRTDGSTAARIDPVSGKLVQQPTITIDSHFKGFTILQSVNDSANHEIEYDLNPYVAIYNIYLTDIAVLQSQALEAMLLAHLNSETEIICGCATPSLVTFQVLEL